jgi:hypothetical protein
MDIWEFALPAGALRLALSAITLFVIGYAIGYAISRPRSEEK